MPDEQPQYLYHGTLAETPVDGWLNPEVGKFVRDSYEDSYVDEEGNNFFDEEVKPLVYMAGEEDVGRAFNAIAYRVAEFLGKRMNEVTAEDMAQHGALYRAERDEYEHRRADEEGWGEDPVGVEGGDWYSHHPVQVERVAPDEMVRLFENHRLGKTSTRTTLINGEMVELVNRTAAITRTQQQQQAEELEQQYGPDTSDPVYEFKNGWTIRSLKSYADVHREGVLMRNCLSKDHYTPADLWMSHPEGFMYEPDDWENPNLDWADGSDRVPDDANLCQPLAIASDLSLRDPDNLPHATFSSGEWLGKHNENLKPEYQQMVDEFDNVGTSHVGAKWAPHRPDGPLEDPELEALREAYREQHPDSPYDLSKYIDDRECYFSAEAIEKEFPELVQHTGFYDDGSGDWKEQAHRGGEHSWNEGPDGTIYDATHSQIDPSVPVYIGPNDGRYKSLVNDWDEIHAAATEHTGESDPDLWQRMAAFDPTLWGETGSKQDEVLFAPKVQGNYYRVTCPECDGEALGTTFKRQKDVIFCPQCSRTSAERATIRNILRQTPEGDQNWNDEDNSTLPF